MQKFVNAEIEVVSFEMTDIITTSEPFDGEEDPVN